MAGQDQARQHERDRDPEPPDDVAPPAVPASQVSTDEVDALLDEIDDVLESNAEEFVKGFVQKGGQ